MTILLNVDFTQSMLENWCAGKKLDVKNRAAKGTMWLKSIK